MDFEAIAAEMSAIAHGSRILQHRQFISFFGVSATVCEKAWRMILSNCPEGFLPKHLLFGLLLLKTYGTETVCCSVAGVSEKSFRKWSWICIEALSSLNVVSSSFMIDSSRYF